MKIEGTPSELVDFLQQLKYLLHTPTTHGSSYSYHGGGAIGVRDIDMPQMVDTQIKEEKQC